MKFSLLDYFVTNINKSLIISNNNSTINTDWFPAVSSRFADLNVRHLLELISLRTIYSHILFTLTEALEHVIYAFLVYFIVCLIIYKITFIKNANNYWGFLNFIKNMRLPEVKKWRRVLLVTSHPDDECMFFGPLAYSLNKLDDCQVYVLCLSNGNYEKQSHLRREELWKSCSQLGIPADNITLMHATALPDDPNVEWKIEAISNIVLTTVERLDIQAVFTFDRDGVSHHPNHCAVYYATASLCLANLLPKNCKFYTLDSINILRKYLSLFDLLCTCFMSTHWCILSWQEAGIIRRAMKEHKSQMKWFRWLYIYFSRYMFINSLREVNLSDVELEMQIHED